MMSKKRKMTAVVIAFIAAMMSSCGIKNGDNYEAAQGEQESIIEEEVIDNKISGPKGEYPGLVYPQTNQMEYAFYSEGIYCIFDGQKYGYVDKDGRLRAPYIYDSAVPFHEGLACVSIDGKYGYIDEEGETVIPFLYDRATPFQEGLAYFERDGNYGFINQSGEEAFLLDYDSVSTFHEGLAYVSRDGKYGYINQSGEEVIPLMYDDADFFNDGLAKVRAGGGIGIIDINNDIIIPTEFNSIDWQADFAVISINGKYGCYNKQGEQLLPAEYNFIEVKNSYIIFLSEGYGAADSTGKIILKPIYDELRIVTDNHYFIAALDDKMGAFNSKGQETIPIIYDQLYFSSADESILIGAMLDGKGGYLNISDGSTAISFSYDGVTGFINGRAAVKLDESYGVIDENENIIIPVEYDWIQIYENDAILVKNQRGYSLADYEGNMLMANRHYDEIKKEGDYFSIEYRGQYGYMDSNGQMQVPLNLKSIDKFQNPLYQIDSLWATIREAGEEYPMLIQLFEEDSDYTLFQNEITPGIMLYHDYKIEQENMSERELIEKNFRLYSIEGFDKPVLYMDAADVAYQSGFYYIDDDEVHTLVSSADGLFGMRTWSSLFTDKQSRQIVIGQTFDSYYQLGMTVYTGSEGVLVEDSSGDFFLKSIEEYSEEELAGALYDNDGNLYTKEQLEEAEGREELFQYVVNGSQVTIEEFDEFMDQYHFITLLK